MTPQVEIELTEILREAREQARFLGELGVETVDLPATKIAQAPETLLSP